MEQMEIESSTKRVPKLTAKAQEDKLQQLKGARKAKLRYLTRKMKEIEALMDDANNAGDVNAIISGDFAATYIEFCAANDAVKTLMSDAQVFDDQAQWFEPKAKYLNAFVEKSESWLQEVNKQENEAKRLDAEIEPADSVSLIHSQNSKRQNASRPSSVVSSAVSSTVSATSCKAEAQKAALLARVGTLQKRVEIERQEALLKARREELELQTAIAAVNAKLEVLTVKESDCPANVAFREDVTVNQRGPDQGSECSFSTVLSEHDDFGQKGHGNRAQSTLRHSDTGRSDRPHLLRDMFGNQLSTDHGSAVGVQDLLTVMQRQNEITKLLVKQQKVSTLPPINIPVFSGNPLEFSFFLKAFEHGIEERTESNKDRLHFLEQFTQGRPKVLVRSCAYMNPDKGYVEAKRLLCKNFGNEYTIASAYIQKALQWPVIRSEDGDALTEFAVFLTSCCNTVDSVDYMNEMDSTTNMRIIISKLPFKIKEKWRGVACDIQEKSGKKVRFTDVVNFVDKQAKIASHPLFGNIQEPASPKQRHEKEKRENAKRHKEKKSVFATDVTSDTSSSEQAKGNTSADGIEKQCVFCQKKGHTLDCCRIIKQKPNKEKLDFLKSKGLCFGCLKQGHLSKGCKQKQICQTCSKKHPTILHFDREESAFSAEESQITQQTVQSSASTDNETCGCTGAGEAACALSIVPVKVRCLRSNRTVEAYAFLDPGSTGTFCTEELMRNLMTTGKKTNILLRTMGKEGIVSTNVVMGLEVSAVDEDNFIKLPKVFTQSKIPFRKENIPQQSDVDRWPYLRDVQLKRIDGEIGLLIGTNVPKALEPWKVINSDGNGPYAVKTLLGWTINGPLKEENASGESSEWPRVTVNRISVATLEELTERQIKLDFPEHDMAEKLEMSFEDKQFMDSVSNSVKMVDGHYSIGLPFKNKDIVFPDNSVFAVQRAECLKRKLIKNPQLHQDYSKFMAQTLTNGYAQEVPTEDDRKSNKRTWYIPHHGVYHPTKHKLRVVFDCAATYRGTSLNSCLLQGPDLTSSLIGVLTRFRQEPIAFMADIEGMFNQVKVPQEDADVLRFLWWPQGDLSQQLKKYRMVVHIFGATSSPSCASYALRKCAEDNQAHFSSTAANTILRNFYVDDCLKSVGTEKQAIALIQDLEAMCAAGGFKLTKWVSNSKSVLASVREEERADKVKMLDLENDCLPIERALGVQWCVEADTLQFRVCIQSKPLTRRGVLSMVSTIYDPLGILAPIILPVKHILQELCRTKHAWDDDMPEALAMQWQQWVMTLDHLTTFEVKRCIKPANFGEITSARLHHFADASEKGYGVATYLVSRNCQNQTHCAFIMGKARVTPLKPVTIPRLELTAAVVAARMDKMIRAELDINLTDSIFWTDSTSVLQYLKNETTRYRTFVANRVAAIRDRTETSQWRYVNTSANPPYASHFGGIWERQIRTLRKILSSILHQQAVDEEGLHTLLCEVEAIINSRPISRISTDPNDLEALTPNHLLLMKAKTSLPPGLFDRKDVYSRRRWRQVQYLADLFWRRWTKEYLPDLQKRQKWSRPQRNISEDDIVLIVNDSAPRNSWMMGRVVETIKDVKGQVRQARVKSSSGVFLRPVTKLCLLVEGDM
ncbi:uncharacterized protein LOC109530618 [Hippocampus comes]|uniref:uncharacterized protein LOC109530618 n=1 Tax=Hippocampus comes TaxID=109280 RepID=UPI00094F25E4|nr:PREDICTED: uncharacterized protein LOC109530618 [Hippocampus comes]